MADIPVNVATFVKENIDSVEQLEILLLLRSNPEKQWTPEDVSRVLSTSPQSAAARLAEFHSRGLLGLTASQKRQYHYLPRSPELDKTIGELAEAFTRYRVRVINLIFSKPIGKIRTFEDPFKVRNEEE
jgi:hypothetical protein